MFSGVLKSARIYHSALELFKCQRILTNSKVSSKLLAMASSKTYLTYTCLHIYQILFSERWLCTWRRAKLRFWLPSVTWSELWNIGGRQEKVFVDNSLHRQFFKKWSQLGAEHHSVLVELCSDWVRISGGTCSKYLSTLNLILLIHSYTTLILPKMC